MEWRYNSIPWRYNTEPLIGRNDGENGMFTHEDSVFRRRTRRARGIYYALFGCSIRTSHSGTKSTFDHFASLGINHKCIHAVFYSLRGRSKRISSHINYHQPYWENYKLMNDYIARTSWFISQGNPVRDIVVIHPIESAFCEYGPIGPNAVNAVIGRRDITFLELLKTCWSASAILNWEMNHIRNGACESGRIFSYRNALQGYYPSWLITRVLHAGAS